MKKHENSNMKLKTEPSFLNDGKNISGDVIHQPIKAKIVSTSQLQ